MTEVERLTAKVADAEIALARAKQLPNGINARRQVRHRTEDLTLLRSALRRAQRLEETQP